MQAGMNDVITKPIRRQSLMAAVNRWLGQVPTNTASGGTWAAGASAGPARGGTPPLDFAVAVEEFGSRQTVEQVIGRFLETVEGQLVACEAMRRAMLIHCDGNRIR